MGPLTFWANSGASVTLVTPEDTNHWRSDSALMHYRMRGVAIRASWLRKATQRTLDPTTKPKEAE
jgi:hypothetical protein